MLIFFDETFREHQNRPFGALCGIAIPEKKMTRIAQDVYRLKVKHLGPDYGREHELHGTKLLKNWVFRLEERGQESKNLDLVRDLLKYIKQKKLNVFGCVCFEKKHHRFQCESVYALDKTFRFVFERVDIFMKIHHPDEMAAIIFDDREYGTNKKNSEAITNFFLRSPDGLAMDSVLDTPFFAISQAQNIGLQLADLVTTVIGMRFQSHPDIAPFFGELKKSFFRWEFEEGRMGSGLKVLRSSQ